MCLWDRQTNIVQLNYLTKYLELLDTCFLFLKKKPLSTLQFRKKLLRRTTSPNVLQLSSIATTMAPLLSSATPS